MPTISDVRTPIVYFDINTGSLLLWDGSVTGAVGGGGGLTDTQLRATPVPVLATIDTTGLATSTGQTTGNNSLSSIDGKLTNPLPVSLPTGTVTTLTPPAAITGYGLETTQLLQATATKQDAGNSSLSSIDTKLTNPLPVSLPAATVTTLTPPAAITGFALDSSLVTLNAKDFATAALQTSGNATLTAISAVQPSTLTLDGQTVAFSTDYVARRMQEAQYVQNVVTSMNTIISSESETSQRAGFELR